MTSHRQRGWEVNNSVSMFSEYQCPIVRMCWRSLPLVHLKSVNVFKAKTHKILSDLLTETEITVFVNHSLKTYHVHIC